MNRLIIFQIVFSGIYPSLSAQDIYDIKINYCQVREIRESSTSKNLEIEFSDSLLIFFETGFDENEIDISVNSRELAKEKITTDKSYGAAASYVLGTRSQVENISFRIDNGRLIYVEPAGYKYIIVNYVNENQVVIEFTDRFPYYD